ncbi:MAG: hypothetical protein KKB50_12720, partial [Planctomycetes bacterium]|nr:hypothetical protein [Planctomycetota bacterium]
LLLLLAARRDSWWLYALAGCVWGLAALARPNVLACAPGILIWLWLVAPRSRRLLNWVRNAALTCLAGALVVLPVSVRNYVVGGEAVLIASQGGVNFYIGNNPYSDGFTAVVPGTRPTWWGGFEDTHRIVARELGHQPSESEVSAFWYARAWEWMRAEPGAWLRLTVKKLRLFWSPVELQNNQPIWFFARCSGVSRLFWVGFPVVTCLAAAALPMARRRWRAWFLPLAFSALYMGTVVAFFCPARYRLPIVPVLIVAAATGIVGGAARLRLRRWKSVAAYLAVGGVAAVVLATNPPDRAEHQRKNEAEGHYLLGLHYENNAVDEPGHEARTLEHYRLAVEYNPGNAQLRLGLADCLSTQGHVPAADEQYARALELAPHYVEAYLRCAEHFSRSGRFAPAAQMLREAYQRAPAELRVINALARLLATAPDPSVRDGVQAVRLAEQAAALAGRQHPQALETLAAAYATAGRWDEAVATASQAAELARASGREQLAQRLEALLRRYRQRLPAYRTVGEGGSP